MLIQKGKLLRVVHTSFIYAHTYLEVFIEISKFNDNVTGHDWKREVNLEREREEPVHNNPQLQRE